MKSLFESFRKFALNEEQDQDVKNAVEQKLKDEGGAAGMEPLLDAAKEVSEEMTEEELEKFLDELESVGKHIDGDFILDDTAEGGVIHIKNETTIGDQPEEDEDDEIITLSLTQKDEIIKRRIK